MPEVFDMKRDDLVNLFQKLDNDFNRYAYLYTVLEGNLILQNAYNTLSKKFGKSLNDYERPALDILNRDPDASALAKKVDSAEKECKKLKERTETYKPDLMKKLTQKSDLIVLILVALVGWYFLGLWWLILVAAGAGYLFYMASRANEFVSDFAKAKKEYSSLYDQLESKLTSKENELWQKDFKAFCSSPENQQIINDAIDSTKRDLSEFNTLDFSKYAYLPAMYQDNQSIHNSLQYLLTGQASTWQDCAQLLSQHEFQERQLNEARAQTQNQAQMLNNQKQMIKNQKEALANQQQIIENQQTQIDTMNEMNQNIKNVNKEIKKMKNSMRRHALMQEAQMSEMIHKQSAQMFQQRRFQRKQLNEMRTSINSAVNSINYSNMAGVPVA